MSAPIVVVLSSEYAEAVRLQLLSRDVSVTTDQVTEALIAAARFEDATPQPDLFGSS